MVLHPPEPGSCVDLDLWIGFGIFVDFDVDVEEMFDCVFFEEVFVAVFLETDCD